MMGHEYHEGDRNNYNQIYVQRQGSLPSQAGPYSGPTQHVQGHQTQNHQTINQDQNSWYFYLFHFLIMSLGILAIRNIKLIKQEIQINLYKAIFSLL
jgi:hypothetical protein